MAGVTMFAECVAAGAMFGIKAFFAVIVFLLCCATVLGIMTIISKAIGGDDDDHKTPRTL